MEAVVSPNAEIPVGKLSVCVSINTTSDAIPEDDESVQVIVTPNNPLDVVNQNITFLIIDNDGQYCIQIKLLAFNKNISLFRSGPCNNAT